MEDLWAYAAARRDAGIEASSRSSGEEWKDYAIGFVRGYLQTHPTLFVDDLWEAGLIPPRSPRALGAVMQAAAREDWMEPQMVDGCTLAKPSVRSNGQLKAVWRSKLHQ